MLGKNFLADDILKYFPSFSQKIDFDIECQSLFSGKNNKEIKIAVC